jgi:hypothetical protein
MTSESQKNGARRKYPLRGNSWVNMFPMATDMHATKDKLLEKVFSMWSVPRLYSEDQRDTLQCMRLMDHVMFNFNDNMSTVVIFLDLKNPFIQHGNMACYTSYIN